MRTQKYFSRFSFDFDKPTILLTFITIAAIVSSIFLPHKYSFENSIIENIQLVILTIAILFCLKAKENKNLFMFIAMLTIIIFLREINCGRIFFPIDGTTDKFKQWEEIQYGFLVIPAYGLFMIYALFYFFQKKLWKISKEYLTSVKIPIVPYIILFAGIAVSTIAEKLYDDQLAEESFESLAYLAIATIIYLHIFNEKYAIKS